jgi:hypothetical protein
MLPVRLAHGLDRRLGGVDGGVGGSRASRAADCYSIDDVAGLVSFRGENRHV